MKNELFVYKDKLHFGKYKGLTIKSVLTRDPQYLLWVYANMPDVYISEHIIREADRRLSSGMETYKKIMDKKRLIEL